MASTRSRECRKRSAGSKSSISWSSAIPTRRRGPSSRSARTASICSPPARASRWTARAQRPTVRCNGARRLPSPSSNRRTTTTRYTSSPASSASPTGCSRTSRSRTARSRPRTSCARLIAAGGQRAIAANRPSGSRRICAISINSTWSRSERQRTIPRSAAITTACLGRAGEPRDSGIPGPRSSTTPTCR